MAAGLVEGRSKQAFKSWLADRPKPWRDGMQVVAMDGFAGFKTAAAEEFHGHRGHTHDPPLEKQQNRLEALSVADEHVEVQAIWAIYQCLIVAYRDPDRIKDRELMGRLIASVGQPGRPRRPL